MADQLTSAGRRIELDRHIQEGVQEPVRCQAMAEDYGYHTGRSCPILHLKIGATSR